MNSLYGKHAQRTFPRYYMGLYEDCLDMAEVLINNGIIEDAAEVDLQFVNSGSIPLFEFKYNIPGDEDGHVGTTVRFASFITAVARVNLMRGVTVSAELLGRNSVCYGDTDSVMLNIPLEEDELL